MASEVGANRRIVVTLRVVVDEDAVGGVRDLLNEVATHLDEGRGTAFPGVGSIGLKLALED
jgi:hypothetical protein